MLFTSRFGRKESAALIKLSLLLIFLHTQSLILTHMRARAISASIRTLSAASTSQSRALRTLLTLPPKIIFERNDGKHARTTFALGSRDTSAFDLDPFSAGWLADEGLFWCVRVVCLLGARRSRSLHVAGCASIRAEGTQLTVSVCAHWLFVVPFAVLASQTEFGLSVLSVAAAAVAATHCPCTPAETKWKVENTLAHTHTHAHGRA